jgi:tetratricopeptide (TPR) repeat protein
MESPELTPLMLGSLANHLRDEGMAAYQRDDLRQAMIWFAQCLDVLRQIGHNEEMISMLLYHIGMVYGLIGNNAQALAFFEASADIQQNQTVEEATADTLHLIGRAIVASGYPEAAQSVLGKAGDMYRALKLRAKSEQVQEEIKNLAPRGHAVSTSTTGKPREFAVRVGAEEAVRFTVSPTGAVNWGKFGGLSQPIPLGDKYPWDIVAVGYAHSERRIKPLSSAALYKLGSLEGNNFVEYRYRNTYDLEQTMTYRRLRIGAANNHGTLVLNIMRHLSAPYFLLYVLHTSRRGNELARYQSPALEFNRLAEFLTAFQDFLTADGRHDLWLHSVRDRATVVWDRHNLIYVYGPLSTIENFLAGLGFAKEAPRIPMPHRHNYHPKYDELENRLIRYLEWTRIPLQPEDQE